MRGGIISEEDIPKDLRSTLGDSVRARLNTLIHDVITNSMGRPEIIMSGEVGDAMAELRKYMFKNVYVNPQAKGEETKAIQMIEKLYFYYEDHIDLLPKQYLDRLDVGDTEEQIVCDYIAGMTDTYAVKKFEDLFVPKSWNF